MPRARFNPRAAVFTQKDYTFRRVAQLGRRVAQWSRCAAQTPAARGAMVVNAASRMCSRAHKRRKRRKNAARLAASVKNPRFSSLLLLLTDDDLVSLDSPWAIRPYANQ